MDDFSRREFLRTCAGVGALMIFPQDAPGLVVHEWGVVSVPQGSRAAHLRTAGAATVGGVEKAPDLPPFVTTWEVAVKDAIEKWRNEPVIVFKPVVYFYTKERTTANVSVSVPTGRPKSWWPSCQFAPQPRFPVRGRGEMDPPDPKLEEIEPKDGLLRWTGLDIDPAAKPTLDAAGWWPLARKTDAACVRAGKEVEKFIFYDALADWSPDAAVEWTKDEVAVRNGSKLPYQSVIALRVRKGECASASHAALAPGATATLKPAKGLPGLSATLVAAGLYPKEAASLVEIWADEFFKTDGVRLLVVVSRDAYDAFLPIEVLPKPREMARVLIAHLECLDESRAQQVRDWIDQLSGDSIDGRDAAAANLRRLGPLAEGMIRDAAQKATDQEAKSRLLELLPRK